MLHQSIRQSKIPFSSQEQDSKIVELFHLWQQFFSDTELKPPINEDVVEALQRLELKDILTGYLCKSLWFI